MKRVHLSNTKKLFDFPDHFIDSFDWITNRRSDLAIMANVRCVM